MKKTFTFSILFLSAVFLLSSCSKRGYYDFDDRYWLNQERGVVVYSSYNCNYYVLETYNGYTIIRASGGIMPYEGDVIYGDLSHFGYGSFYNRSYGGLINGTLTDFWLNYSEAQNRIDYYCY
ncbi:MAG: hypothetical protein GC171_06895 [Terrimonas sp.]|nr:hypothetical protein [Terrimonas sp.]